MSGHYGHAQEVLAKQAERCEQQDLEKRLAEIYAGIEGGEDASDLTAPRGTCGAASVCGVSCVSVRVLTPTHPALQRDNSS